MGQRANSGRNATLDEKKRRAAGRSKQESPQRRQVRDARSEDFAKGKTAGAFGKGWMTNRCSAGARATGTRRSSKPS